MEQAVKTCFHFKVNAYAKKITLGDIDFLVYGIFSFIFNVGGWIQK